MDLEDHKSIYKINKEKMFKKKDKNQNSFDRLKRDRKGDY